MMSAIMESQSCVITFYEVSTTKPAISVPILSPCCLKYVILLSPAASTRADVIY